jgi:LysM repeat protein
MVEGLTSSATDQGSVAGGPRAPCPRGRLSGLSRDRRSIHRSVPARAGAALPNDIQTHQILVTLAERPHPFPSRTRKLSSPAPKILRGQPFGNIGRRQDFCVSGPVVPVWRGIGAPAESGPRWLSLSDMTTTSDPGPILAVGRGSVCPYLQVTVGQWRHATPSRDHRCGAEPVPVIVGLEAQRRLCLGEPGECERHRSAEEARRALAPALPTRPIARTAPVVVERGRSAIAVPRVADRRTLSQAALAVLMVAAAAALIVARTGGPVGSLPGGVASPPVGAGAPTSSASSPISGAAGSPTQAPNPMLTPTPSPKPTPSPNASPNIPPGTTRTYRVRSGDTLSAIAARYGTTVQVLQTLNGISDPSVIRPGQVLQLP